MTNELIRFCNTYIINFNNNVLYKIIINNLVTYLPLIRLGIFYKGFVIF